ncbi:MAG: metallophosphoesterase [Bryobacteraceae bacterium]|nr:metallophosphoesterase [Bryobacteraceae bacterium]
MREALEKVRAEAASAPADEFYMPRDRMGALVQSAMAHRMGLRSGDLGADFFFSNADPGWASVLPSLIERWLSPNAKFRSHKDHHQVNFAMADSVKVALFSDWGTGRPAADHVMLQIQAQQPDILIHLGDIYYSGQHFEAQERFLDHLPQPTGPRPIRRFALNGNHEMYSGGHGYFDTVLARMDHKASYFCLENSRFRLIGLDSAYEDKALREPQLEWLEKLVAPNDGRKNILLTHHQAFSMFEDVNPRDLYEPVRPLIEAGKIHFWFWGHEHKHVLFLKYKGLVARCIGHGAIPYTPPGTDFSERTFPDLRVKFVNRRRRPGSLQCVNGFALLRFSGERLEADYIDEDGVTKTEDLTAVLSGVSD